MAAGASSGSADRDQVDGYQAAWRSFQALRQPADHRRDWAAWAAGRSAHVLLVVPVRERRTVAHVQRLRGAMADIPCLDLHPPHFLHVSVQSFGFLGGGHGGARAADELDGPALGELIPRLARGLAEVPTFELSLGRVNAFQSSVFLETWSAGGLRRVRDAARSAAAGVVPLHEMDPFPGYLFHLTLGYLDATTPLAPLRQSLRAQRGGTIPPIPLRVEAVELVRLPADQREPYPVLECLARFPLRGTPPTPSSPGVPGRSAAGLPAP